MKKLIWTGILSISQITSVFCQGLFESSTTPADDQSATSVEWNGYVRGSVYGGSEDYDFTSLFGEMAIQPKLNYYSAFFYSDLHLRSGYFFGEDTVILQVKELYAGYNGDKFQVYLGNQIVQWGRTDGFNPTNNITPNDYFFFSAEPDDQKLSNTMLRVKYLFSPHIDLDLVAIPIYKPSVYRYDLFSMVEGANFISTVYPEQKLSNGSFAGRLNFEFDKAGFSFSYFTGYDPFYGFRVDNIDLTVATPVIQFAPDFYRKKTIGGDFAFFLGTWIIRGEAAYNLTEDYEDNMYIPNPGLNYVVGLEHNFAGFTAIFQYIGNYASDFTELRQPPTITDPTDPLAQLQYNIGLINYEASLFNRKIFQQQEETNHTLFLSLNKSFAHDVLSVGLTGYYDLTAESYMFRPSLSWKINDSLESTLGGSYMDGPDKAIFNYAGPVMNGIYIEFKANF